MQTFIVEHDAIVVCYTVASLADFAFILVFFHSASSSSFLATPSWLLEHSVLPRIYTAPRLSIIPAN